MNTNPDHVICTACAHQFRAIPENAQAELAAAQKDAERYRRIGWAQQMGESSGGKLLLMETTLPKEELHDNGRPMYPLFIYDAAIGKVK